MLIKKEKTTDLIESQHYAMKERKSGGQLKTNLIKEMKKIEIIETERTIMRNLTK